MNRKQRIHSAEIRRLDHIARSLDRIGDAMERLHEVVVSGNNDFVNVGNSNHNVGGDGSITIVSTGNDSAAAGSGTATVNSRNHTQNFNDEVNGGNMPMGDLRRDITTYGENSQGIVDGAVDYNQSPNKPGTG